MEERENRIEIDEILKNKDKNKDDKQQVYF